MATGRKLLSPSLFKTLTSPPSSSFVLSSFLSVKLCKTSMLTNQLFSSSAHTLSICRTQSCGRAICVPRRAPIPRVSRTTSCWLVLSHEFTSNFFSLMLDARLGRTHRIGQEKETTVFQYYISNTVDYRVAELRGVRSSPHFAFVPYSAHTQSWINSVRKPHYSLPTPR